MNLLQFRKPLNVIVFLLAGCLLIAGTLKGQELPPCGDRATYLSNPWTDATRFCLEDVIRDSSAGEPGFTALAAAPDGTLYAARPMTGEVLAITDSDDDGLPDRSEVIAVGLTQPNGLAYADGALYITGGSHLYRWRAGELETLVDNLPSVGGFWTGGVAVGSDERIYVATGAPCDACESDDVARGAILSFDLEGGDRQIVASGLRNPADLAFHAGALWTIDSARDDLFDTPNLDELNQVAPDANFGWPYCVGQKNQPDLFPGEFDCATAAAPALVFQTASSPFGLASYTRDALPSLNGALLVVLRGSYNQVDLRGYALVAVYFDEDGQPIDYDALIPSETGGENQRFQGFSLQTMNYRTSGFWPRRPLDVTVSPEGWIYVSVSGGQIIVLRPR